VPILSRGRCSGPVGCCERAATTLPSQPEYS